MRECRTVDSEGGICGPVPVLGSVVIVIASDPSDLGSYAARTDDAHGGIHWSPECACWCLVGSDPSPADSDDFVVSEVVTWFNIWSTRREMLINLTSKSADSVWSGEPVCWCGTRSAADNIPLLLVA